MPKFLLTLALALVLSPTAHAQIDPAKEADIRSLLELTRAGRIAENLITTMTPMITGQLEARFPNVPQEALDIVAETIEEAFNEGLHADGGFLDQLIPLYDQHFTHAEVRELLEFWRSDVGQKLAAKQDILMKEGGVIGAEWGGRIGAQLGPRIQERLREAGYGPG